MDEKNNQFRGSAFGGFNRHDVLHYLTETENQYEKNLSELRNELERSRKAAEESAQAYEEANQQLMEMIQVRELLQEELEKAQAEREEKELPRRQAEEESFRLRVLLVDMEPKSIASDRLKDRAASIEMDAHERAQVTLEQAQVESAQMREECQLWMQKIQTDYLTLRSNLYESFTKASGEMDLIGEQFQRLMTEFDAHEEAVSALVERSNELLTVE